MASLSGLGKRQQGILRNQSTPGFFGFESNFWNVFEMFLEHLVRLKSVK
jgi:hypothetical protein